MDLFVAAFVTALLPLSWFSDWLERQTVEQHEYHEIDYFRVWTRVRRLASDGQVIDVRWLIKLPSWDWREDIYCRKYCWHQRVWVSGLGLTYWPLHEVSP